ncbi:hypothetical protein [Spirosoma harenae]
MNFYIRLLCYTDPSRQKTVQIHDDIPVSEFPSYCYGQPIHVGNGIGDPVFWPVYIIANIPQMRQIDDPDCLGEKTLLITVFVVEEDAWMYFDMPPVVKLALDLRLAG